MGDQVVLNASGIAPEQPEVAVVPETPAQTKTRIACEVDLERFAALPVSERVLTEPLRCVLVETALTGVIRYNWALLRPLVEYLIEQTLRTYDGAAQAEAVGPPRPAFPGEGLADTITRFRSYLGRFSQAPWTLQRLCEVLLAPLEQYSKLHKVALAIEKCLLVTSEVGVTSDPPPPGYVEDLQQQPVNCNPPPVAPRAPSQSHADDVNMESSNAFTNSLLEVYGSPPSAPMPPAPAQGQSQVRAAGPAPGGQQPAANAVAASQQQSAASHAHHPHHHHAAGSHNQGSPGAGITAAEHMEEDHWPEGPLRPGLPLHGMVNHMAHHPHHTHPGALHPAAPGAPLGVLPGHPTGNHVASRGGASVSAHGEHRQIAAGSQPGDVQVPQHVAQHVAQEAAAVVAAAAAAVQAQLGAQGGVDAQGALLQPPMVVMVTGVPVGHVTPAPVTDMTVDHVTPSHVTHHVSADHVIAVPVTDMPIDQVTAGPATDMDTQGPSDASVTTQGVVEVGTGQAAGWVEGQPGEAAGPAVMSVDEDTAMAVDSDAGGGAGAAAGGDGAGHAQ